MKSLLSILILLSTLQLEAQKVYTPYDFNRLNKNSFKNDFFNLSVDINKNWTIFNEHQLSSNIKLQTVLLKDVFDASVDSITLERITQEQLILLVLSSGSSMQHLPLIMISWEPISSNSIAQDNHDYLNGYLTHIETQFLSSGIVVKKEGERFKTLGSQEFLEYELGLFFERQRYAGQTILCGIRNNCFIKIMLNYESEEDLVLINQQIEKINFGF